jgi:multidrug efflux pump subunit AcrA (membrane-fusion protein)
MLFVWMAAAALATNGCRKAQKTEEPADLRPLVRVGPLVPAFPFTDGARVQGVVRTKFSAAVAARVPGTIDAVMTDEGETVKAGQPLFQIDKVTLENRVRLAEDDLNVAKAVLREAEAARVEALASLDKAEVDAKRMATLFNDSKAVTKDAWEKADLQRKVAAAVRERAQAAVESANPHRTGGDHACRGAQRALRFARRGPVRTASSRGKFWTGAISRAWANPSSRWTTRASMRFVLDERGVVRPGRRRADERPVRQRRRSSRHL